MQFDIKETVNKNIERVQFPQFSQHNTLLGWSSMNYPKVLLNPLLMPKPQPKVYDDNLDRLYQKKKDVPQMRPLTQAAEDYKKSLLQLTTTKNESKAVVYEETFKDYDKYMNIKPLACQFPNQNFTRHIRQIGEVFYNQSYESEEIRHLKKVPNSILTEQNLQEVMTANLKFLNLHNHTWIAADQISKIGYFAVNLEELILSSTDLEDEVLVELGKSCKQLKRIDISRCPKLSESGVRMFLDSIKGQIQGFKSAHNQSTTDYALEPLRFAKNLQILNLSFTNITLSLEPTCKLQSLELAGVEVANDYLAELIARSKSEIRLIDLSFCTQVNESVMQAISMCQKIQSLNLTGCSQLTDNTLGKASGLPQLRYLRLGGLQSISDNSISQFYNSSPLIELLELNNVIRLSEHAVENILKALPDLKVLSLNFTPEITDAFLQSKSGPVKIIRNINKHTDPKDDGLRMPLPLESVVMQRPKKKKKK